MLNKVIIEGLRRNSITSATIKEDIDLATTHLKKVRFMEDFKVFAQKHAKNLLLYKRLILSFLTTGKQIPNSELLDIYNDMLSTYSYVSELLDFLYILTPDEDELTYSHCLNSALLAGIFAGWAGMSRKRRKA